MLVYLDSAHLALLHRGPLTAVDDFVAEFGALGGELALSLLHFQEISAIRDEDINSRLLVLARFPVIRAMPAGSATAISWEAQVQLLTMHGVTIDARNQGRSRLFPRATIQRLTGEAVSALPGLRRLNLLSDGGAGLERNARLMRGLPKSKAVSPDADFSAARAQFRQAITGNQPKNDWIEGLLLGLADHAVENLKVSGTEREALLRAFGLRDKDHADNFLDSDLSLISGFFQLARMDVDEWAADFNADPQELIRHISSLDPYAAPGFALKLAVRRERLIHSKEPEAADQVDEDHVVFAPYVDLLFVDKRTYDFAQRARHPKRRPLVCSGADALHKASDLTDVLDQMRRHT